jgi:hypothetical protein
MSKFEVQEYCIFGGWTNTWTHTQDGSNAPVYYTSREGAQEELDWYLKDMAVAVNEGDVADIPDPDDFRIVEVEDGT